MYDIFACTAPVWEGTTAYRESFLPRSRKVDLLYPAKSIVCVENLAGTVTYKEGKDYVLENGSLIIPEGSEIRILTDEEYNPAVADAEHHTELAFECINGGYLMFGEGHFFHDISYAVTYNHEGKWDGLIPTSHAERLLRTKAKLAKGEKLKFGFLGDSIGAGANASGVMGAEPFMPSWPKLVCEKLQALTGSDVECINHSVGGMDSNWGVSVVEEKFADNVPDVLLIEFGMNDGTGGMDRWLLCANCRIIAQKIRKLNPLCEVIFVSTTMPNPISRFLNKHETYEYVFNGLADEFGADGEAVPMTSIHKTLLEKKNYWDMTGNNINHPNDYLVRVYAQAILAVLGY
ncbi:MAG: SGNH/GDSL hydrolase family protein [Clostridia bacterium]|nr:SGNH/GDSL hydrolase family protein [Clostridia bacterium]